MGIMGYLRERMGKILAIVIGIALFAFIIGEVVRSGGSFFRDSGRDIGEVAGDKISYSLFAARLDENTKQFQQQQGGGVSPQITNYLQESTWSMLVNQTILKKEIDKLGLVIGETERKDVVSGPNPDAQIVRQFSDPQTGQFDRSRYDQFLTYIKTSKDTLQRGQWLRFVNQVWESKLTEKYLALIHNGLYVNSLEAKDNYEAKNKLVNFKYAMLDYASIPDSKVTITDDDYSAYYNDHKTQFKNPQELRSFEYVAINAAPSKEDTASVKEQTEKLVADFKASTNDSLFVQINADTKSQIVFQKKGQLEPKLDSVMFSAEKGFVYGPYLSNGSYKIAKLVDSRVGPDSVKASHILLNPATLGGVDEAVAKADSIKKLIAEGKSFADLAKQFSTDKVSAEKGGDLGTFGRGTMIPAFDNVVFDGHTGDLKVITTQFGVHIIKINEQKGSSKVVKIALVDKPLVASSKTLNTAFNKAQGFLGSLTKDNFDAEIKKQGLEKKNADDVKGIAAALPGIDDARPIVKWVFKSDVGDFSDEVFSSSGQYIVARVTAIKPEGTLSLDAVKKQIEPMVRQKVKARMLTEKLQAAATGASSIDQVAQKAAVKAVPVQNVVLANPVIPGLSTEYAVVGTLFGSGLHKISKPIEGQAGVFVVSVDGFTTPAPLTNTVREKQQLSQALLQRADNQVFEALKDKANVKDYRAKFL